MNSIIDYAFSSKISENGFFSASGELIIKFTFGEYHIFYNTQHIQQYSMQVTSIEQPSSSNFVDRHSSKILLIPFINRKDQQIVEDGINNLNSKQKRKCLDQCVEQHLQQKSIAQIEIQNLEAEFKMMIKKIQKKNPTACISEQEGKSIKFTIYTEIRGLLLTLMSKDSNKFQFSNYRMIQEKLICPRPTDIPKQGINLKALLQRDELASKINYLASKKNLRERQWNKLIKNEDQLHFSFQSSNQLITSLKKQILDLRKSCEEKLATKSSLQKSLIKMRKTKHQLIQNLKNQNAVILQELIEKNQINQNIQQLRDQYQKIQSQNFLLDAKNENIRRYGSQQVPPQLTQLKQKEDELKEDLRYLRKQYQYEKQSIQFLIPKNVLHNLNKKLDHLCAKRDKMMNFIKRNAQLIKQNSELQNQIDQNEIAFKNSEINSLGALLIEEEKAILQKQRQVNQLKKKLAMLSNQSQLSNKHSVPQKKRKGSTHLKNKKTKQNISESRVSTTYHSHSRYEQFKNDLEQLNLSKDCPTCSKNNKNKEKKQKRQGDQLIEGRVQLSATTFRIETKKNWVVFALIIIALFAGCVACQKFYRK